MTRRAAARNLWGTSPARPPPAPTRAAALGEALLAIVQPDLFGTVTAGAASRLTALRRRRTRATRRTAAEELLAEPWSIGATDAPRDAVALARRFLRRHPDRDRADPAPPFLTARQEAAAWHAEEAIAEEDIRRDAF